MSRGDVGKLREAITRLEEGGETALNHKIVTYGRQPESWHETSIHVRPSTAEADGFWDELPWRELARFLDISPAG